jgi:hypothetical protein
MDIEWLVPWIPVEDPKDETAWARELTRECPVGHLLHGREARFVARRQDRDDFLVALSNGEVAMVHLTWAQETDPSWPASALYESLAIWRDEVMVPDHEEWEV